ncbi:MAG TPA: diguanylate cyclase, partial [Symbiobacteriaceae bacterium]|nr:diguanylate cyclase [Symbiobacteriaceae bacterium]
MGRYPVPARILMAATVCVAVALGWLSIRAYGLPEAGALEAMVLGTLSAVTLLYPVRSVRGQSSYALCNIFIFASFLVLSPSWVTVLTVAIWIPALIKRSRSDDPYFWVPPLTNAAQLTAIGLSVTYLVRLTGAGALASLPDLVWLLVVAAWFVIAQTVYVGVLVSLYRRLPFRLVDVFDFDTLLTDAVQPFLGAIVVVLMRVNPGFLLILCGMLGLFYRLVRNTQLIRQAEIDAKTGLYNYRYFEEQIKVEVARSVDLRRPLALVFADLDFLREINNTHGHAAGDKVLVEVATRLSRIGGKLGTAARFGGEEFVLLLPGTDA